MKAIHFFSLLVDKRLLFLEPIVKRLLGKIFFLLAEKTEFCPELPGQIFQRLDSTGSRCSFYTGCWFCTVKKKLALVRAGVE